MDTKQGCCHHHSATVKHYRPRTGVHLKRIARKRSDKEWSELIKEKGGKICLCDRSCSCGDYVVATIVRTEDGALQLECGSWMDPRVSSRAPLFLYEEKDWESYDVEE